MKNLLRRLDERYREMVSRIGGVKEVAVSLSLVLYLVGYLLVGVGGISFSSQPAAAYVEYFSNSNCVAGALWVEYNELHWCGDNDYEMYVEWDSGDSRTSSDGDAPDSAEGAVWLDHDYIHWVSSSSHTSEIYQHAGIVDDNPISSGTDGAIWVGCDGFLRYASGEIEYKLCDNYPDWCSLDLNSIC